MDNRFTIEVNRYFIETEKKNSKGKPVMIPIDVRKMTINGDFIGAVCFQATVVKRGGEQYISVKKLVPPTKPKWPCVLIDKPQEPKWVKEGSYSLEKFKKWLNPYFKGRAEAIVSELLTAPPENLAA